MALALGIFDVDAWLETIAPEKLDQWFEYFAEEPFGANVNREWLCLIAAETVNASRRVEAAVYRSQRITVSEPAAVQPSDYYGKPSRSFMSIEEFEQISEKRWRR